MVILQSSKEFTRAIGTRQLYLKVPIHMVDMLRLTLDNSKKLILPMFGPHMYEKTLLLPTCLWTQGWKSPASKEKVPAYPESTPSGDPFWARFGALPEANRNLRCEPESPVCLGRSLQCEDSCNNNIWSQTIKDPSSTSNSSTRSDIE